MTTDPKTLAEAQAHAEALKAEARADIAREATSNRPTEDIAAAAHEERKRFEAEAIQACSRALSRMSLDPGAVFYSRQGLKLKLTPDWNRPTMATDGSRIFYNPATTVGWDKEERMAVLIHEVLHVLLLHFLRRGNRNLKLWNVATDLAINSAIRAESFKLPKGALFPEQFDLAEGLSAEAYYTKLTDELEQNPAKPDEPTESGDTGDEPGDESEPGDGSGDPDTCDTEPGDEPGDESGSDGSDSGDESESDESGSESGSDEPGDESGDEPGDGSGSESGDESGSDGSGSGEPGDSEPGSGSGEDSGSESGSADTSPQSDSGEPGEPSKEPGDRIRDLLKGDGNDPGQCGGVEDGDPVSGELARDEARQAIEDITSEGCCPKSLDRLLNSDEIGEAWKDIRSQPDPKKILLKYVRQHVRQEYTYKRLGKVGLASGYIAPALRTPSLGHVIIAVDTSGSMSKPAVTQAYAWIMLILSSGIDCKITVVYHTNRVWLTESWTRGNPPLKLPSPIVSGGTAHGPVFEWAKKNARDCTLMIGLTDMQSRDLPAWAAEASFPIVWGMIEVPDVDPRDPDQRNWIDRCTTGEKVLISRKEKRLNI